LVVDFTSHSHDGRAYKHYTLVSYFNNSSSLITTFGLIFLEPEEVFNSYVEDLTGVCPIYDKMTKLFQKTVLFLLHVIH